MESELKNRIDYFDIEMITALIIGLSKEIQIEIERESPEIFDLSSDVNDF